LILRLIAERYLPKETTVAVFGSGVGVLYPKENSRLSEQILSFGGALISEFPLGTFAAPQNFPIRNRIIRGISFGVLVVVSTVAGELLLDLRRSRIARCTRSLAT
jgi:predicted Rossmann fold nucleotide-binding protein DprA/Smf involved in DNA uptake